MKQLPPRTEPRFRWTGLMILFPVLALGAVGLWQLRLDRAAALGEARAGVEDSLEQVLKFGKSVPITTRGSGKPNVIFFPNGEVSWPKPIPLVPSPVATSNPHAEKLKQLLGDPRLSLSEQAHALHELASEENNGTSTAGLPIRQLALRNALSIGKEANFGDSTLRSWALALTIDAIKHPTILSEKFLHEAKSFNTGSPEENETWNRELETWNQAKASRKFLRENDSTVQTLLGELVNQDGEMILSKWIGTAPGLFCQLRKDSQEISLSLHTPEDISQSAKDRFEAISIPRHLGIRLWLGERLVYGDPEAEVLSMANNPKFVQKSSSSTTTPFF